MNYNLPMPLSSRFLTFASSLEVFCGTVSRLGHFAILVAVSSGDDLSLQNSAVAQCDEPAADDTSASCLW